MSATALRGGTKNPQPSNNDEQMTAFIPSKTWLGEKKGFYFGTGDEGTGYYFDTLQQDDVPLTRKKKKVKISEDQNEMKLLIEQLEKKAEGSSILELSKKGVHAASKSLENLYQQNIQKRTEHPMEPEQYMESELALYEQLVALQALATDTQVYGYIENSNLMPTLMQLLEHENTDICASVVSLLLEWIDPLLVAEDAEVLPLLKNFAAVTMEGWETIVLNLQRFQNDEESNDSNLKGVENTLSLMENILELDALLAPTGVLETGNVRTSMVKHSDIVSWLFMIIENTSTKESKNVALRGRIFEVLSLLAQGIDLYTALPDWSKLPGIDPSKKGNTLTTQSINGIESLLQSIALYRKEQPKTDLEIEMLENSSMILSSCISFSTLNLSSFLEGQGVELVIRCLKERMHAGGSCLKLLDFFGAEETHKIAAEKLVTAGGLKYVFPIFVGRRIPKPATQASRTPKAKHKWLAELKAQTIRIFYSLTIHLDSQSPQDAKSRFIAKFVEDDLKYCDRLVELLLEYDERARKAEYEFFRSDIEDNIDDEQVALAAFDAKLSGGGDICFRLAAVIAFVCVNSKRCHQKIVLQLKMHESGISLIKNALAEFSLSLSSKGRQKRLIEELRQNI